MTMMQMRSFRRTSNLLAMLFLLLLASSLVALLLLPVSVLAQPQTVTDWCMNFDDANNADFFDYIVVGAGPGGGVVASRLALAGFKTLLLDAGPDYGMQPIITNPSSWPQSTEDPNVEWRVRVKFTDDAPGRDNVLYPRAAMLGGCATHNAMM
jgi:NAD(P)-binding Rossmann-like domain